MKIVFASTVAKGFAKCIQSLSRIGDDLYIELLPSTSTTLPQTQGLQPAPAQQTEGTMVLYSVNLARTAFTKLALLPSFFDEYDTGSDKPRHFKVLLKTMSNIFKAKNGHVDLIEKCILRLLEGGVNDLDLHGDRLVVELHCKFGVRKIYQLHYQATEPLKASFSKQVCTNTFSASPKIIQDWLTYFSHKLDEVSIGCTTTTADAIGNGLNDRRVIIKSFSEDVFGPGGGAGGAMSNTQGEADPAKRSLSTEISVDFEDFDSFEVFGDVEVTFSLKDLKTALGFADGIGQAIEAHFIGPGQPIIFSTCQPNIFSADFVLATNTFSSGATPTPPPQQQQRHPQNKRSQQEQQQQQHGSSTTNYSQDQEKQHQNPDQPPPLSSTRRTSRQSYASSSSSTTTPNNHHHDSPNLSYHSAAAASSELSGRGPTLKKYAGDPPGAVGTKSASLNPGSWNHDGGRRRRRQRQQEDDNGDDDDDGDDGMPLFSQSSQISGVKGGGRLQVQQQQQFDGRSVSSGGGGGGVSGGIGSASKTGSSSSSGLDNQSVKRQRRSFTAGAARYVVEDSRSPSVEAAGSVYVPPSTFGSGGRGGGGAAGGSAGTFVAGTGVSRRSSGSGNSGGGVSSIRSKVSMVSGGGRAVLFESDDDEEEEEEDEEKFALVRTRNWSDVHGNGGSKGHGAVRKMVIDCDDETQDPNAAGIVAMEGVTNDPNADGGGEDEDLEFDDETDWDQVIQASQAVEQKHGRREEDETFDEDGGGEEEESQAEGEEGEEGVDFVPPSPEPFKPVNRRTSLIQMKKRSGENRVPIREEKEAGSGGGSSRSKQGMIAQTVGLESFMLNPGGSLGSKSGPSLTVAPPSLGASLNASMHPVSSYAKRFQLSQASQSMQIDAMQHDTTTTDGSLHESSEQYNTDSSIVEPTQPRNKNINHRQ